MRAGLGVGFLLAVAATLLVVLSDEVRWLRLAVVLGLWAALTVAFAMAWFRRDARNSELRTVESKRTYELELHREISARREFEISVTASARAEADERHREDLASLREQLDRLTTSLAGLLEGDLLFERLTLSAESTRVRQVGQSGEAGRARLNAMQRPGAIEGNPEQIGPFVGGRSGLPTYQSGPPQQGYADVRGPQQNGARFGESYRPREDDTIVFPRDNFGPAVRPPVPGPANSAAADDVPAAVAPVVAQPLVVPVAVVPVAVTPVAVAPVAVAPVAVVPVAVVPASVLREPVAAIPVQLDQLVVAEPAVQRAVTSALAPVAERSTFVAPEIPALVEPVVELVIESVSPAVIEPVVLVEPVVPPVIPSTEHAPVGKAHSSGISVADLLAAHGGAEPSSRGRRRRD